jgi:hypothetical protein
MRDYLTDAITGNTADLAVVTGHTDLTDLQRSSDSVPYFDGWGLRHSFSSRYGVTSLSR